MILKELNPRDLRNVGGLYSGDPARSCEHLNFCLTGKNKTILLTENPEKFKD